jgi:hypothetical protein
MRMETQVFRSPSLFPGRAPGSSAGTSPKSEINILNNYFDFLVRIWGRPGGGRVFKEEEQGDVFERGEVAQGAWDLGIK